MRRKENPLGWALPQQSIKGLKCYGLKRSFLGVIIIEKNPVSTFIWGSEKTDVLSGKT
ncbi:hypothetical protein T12_13910 [Trichinella patagoniensis]|uniref:Uncharacterized protein n=1 Tax=Trichinella patagoniensis TaxID=990121 RepID=A0A0V0YQB2_9BILA|nr:hypothetical protein T12_13910 [Trichinella patagoniensis]